jgi:hypothetical protein
MASQGLKGSTYDDFIDQMASFERYVRELQLAYLSLQDVPSASQPCNLKEGKIDGTNLWYKQLVAPDAGRMDCRVPRSPLECLDHQLLSKQMAMFVHRIATSHSWYKHLPLVSNSAWIACRLDLTAGMRHLGDQFVDYVETDGTRFHYTWTPSERYRANFGFLSYVQFDTYAHVPEPMLWRPTSTDTSEAVLVPKSSRAEAVYVTAALHPNSHTYGLYEGLFQAFIDGADLSQGIPKESYGRMTRWRPEKGTLPREVIDDFSKLKSKMDVASWRSNADRWVSRHA